MTSRRLLLRAAPLLACLVAVSSATAGSAEQSPAPSATTYQGNTLHNGVASTDIAPPLVETWRRQIPGHVTFPVAGGDRLVVVSDDGVQRVTAYDLRSGNRAWLRTVSGDEYTTVGIGQLTAVVVTGNCTVLAYDLGGGKLLWTRKIWSAGDGFCSAPPVVRRGVVFVQQGRSAHRLFALEASTGRRLWSRAIGTAGYYPPVLTDSRVFVTGLKDVRAYRYDGSLVWRKSCCGQPGGGSPALYRGRLYVRHDGAVLAADTGRRVGTLESDTTPAFWKGVALRVRMGDLEAVDLETRERRWSFSSDADITVPPLVVGDHAYVLSSDGHLSMLRLGDGGVAWEADVPPVAAAGEVLFDYVGMAAVENRLIVPSEGSLAAYLTTPR